MDFGHEEVRRLHEEGCLELGELPPWSVFSFVERFYDEFCEKARALLEKTRKSWSEDGESRPGSQAAWEVSQELEEHGLYVSAVHPSESDDGDWTGPRFYVSVVPAAMESGLLKPPEHLAQLLWPRKIDRKAPMITELGWTLTPPGSNPQCLHSDICADEEDPPYPRIEGRGRFHHFLWKRDRSSLCTTKLVKKGFTDGCVRDWHYEELQQVASPSIILDSEVLHCGSATKSDVWTSTCTVQLCSSSGWKALNTGGRAGQDLLWYVCPMQEPETEPPVWSVGDVVEAQWDGRWYPARIGKRKNGTYRVDWQDEETCSHLSEQDLRAPRSHKAQEAEECLAPPRKRAKLTSLRHLDLEKGYLLLEGLPWRWQVFDFVEACHAEFGGRIEAALEALRAAWPPRGAQRPGAFAAAKVSRRFRRQGISVYAGPPSQAQEAPWEFTGPRFYVSVTRRARAHFGELPPLPRDLERLLWPQEAERRGRQRLRGLGWALAPPGSDPQQLHADIWGGPAHPKQGRVRFPHLLWKRGGLACTTEVLPGGFTKGEVQDEHLQQLVEAKAGALIMDSECLHRGGAVPPSSLGGGTGGGTGWASSCSVELCSASGWLAWKVGTEGTVADPNDEEWQMIKIVRRRRSDSKDEDEQDAAEERLNLEKEAQQEAALLEEQKAWESEAFY